MLFTCWRLTSASSSSSTAEDGMDTLRWRKSENVSLSTRKSRSFKSGKWKNKQRSGQGKAKGELMWELWTGKAKLTICGRGNYINHSTKGKEEVLAKCSETWQLSEIWIPDVLISQKGRKKKRKKEPLKTTPFNIITSAQFAHTCTEEERHTKLLPWCGGETYSSISLAQRFSIT